MGASVDTGGGGRGKGQNFDLNLVPFIDLLSVCITFLLATAVWAQIMALQVDQAIQDPNSPPPPPSETPPTPPMQVRIGADGIWAGRSQEAGVTYPRIPAPAGSAAEDQVYDWVKLKADLLADQEKYATPAADPAHDPATPKPAEDPGAHQVIIVTEDGVRYEHMIATLDLTREAGFSKTLLGGGPAQTGAALPAPK